MADRKSIDGPSSSQGSDDQQPDNVNVVDVDMIDNQNKSEAADAEHISAAMSKLDVGNTKPPEDIPDCAVCLQKCIHPVRLPCTHVFCFLCVKGVAMQSGRCALCRKQITAEFFSNPTVLGIEKGAEEVVLPQQTDLYAWFYEGRNGWWQYEVRTNQELEESYRKKLRTFELLIAGFVYTIDLDNMVQMRRSDPSRRRRIKRDLVSAPKKGIAGLKIAPKTESSGASVPAGASREVLGGECSKSGLATGGTKAPVDGATQTLGDNPPVANQDKSGQDAAGALVDTNQRGTSTDETAYEVLPQPRTSTSATNYAKVNRRHSDQRSHSAEAAASSGQSKTNRTSSSTQKKSKPKPQMRNTVPNHPSLSQTRAHQNDSYGLVTPSQTRATTQPNDSYASVVHHERSRSSPQNLDVNAQDAPTRSSSRGEEEAQTDAQSRRQVRQRKKNLRSSDV